MRICGRHAFWSMLACVHNRYSNTISVAASPGSAHVCFGRYEITSTRRNSGGKTALTALTRPVVCSSTRTSSGASSAWSLGATSICIARSRSSACTRVAAGHTQRRIEASVAGRGSTLICDWSWVCAVFNCAANCSGDSAENASTNSAKLCSAANVRCSTSE